MSEIIWTNAEPRQVINAADLNSVFDITGSLTLDDTNVSYGGFQRRHFEGGEIFNQTGTVNSIGGDLTVSSSVAWETVHSVNAVNVFRSDEVEVVRFNFSSNINNITLTGTSAADKATQFILLRVVLDGYGQVGPILTYGAHGVTNGNGGANNAVTSFYDRLMVRTALVHSGSGFSSNSYRLEARCADNSGSSSTTFTFGNRIAHFVRHKY